MNCTIIINDIIIMNNTCNVVNVCAIRCDVSFSKNNQHHEVIKCFVI